MNARFKQIIAFFFLTFFILIKSGSLHAFTHDDSHADDCAICHVLVSDNHTPAVLLDAQEISFIEYLPLGEDNDFAGYECTFYNRLSPYCFSTRPPPAI